MSATTVEPPPGFVVGHTAVMVAGVEGTVDAIDYENVTINGIVLPRRLDAERGIKYLSMVWPPEPCTTADHDRIGDLEIEVRELRVQARGAKARERRICDAIRDEHDTHHAGPQRFCEHRTCREATA